MDLSTLTYGAPATEPAPIAPIRVDGMGKDELGDDHAFAPAVRHRPLAPSSMSATLSGGLAPGAR
jgi:hypothetical protein